MMKIFIEYRSIIEDMQFIKFMLGGLFAYAVVVFYNVMTPLYVLDIQPQQLTEN